ncbi:MAG: rRNA maturation RNase YbeY [Candidatus Moranbacteria bacterium RIFCSPHIGHO2_01_FULL_55_24]|nr:MAG: rRNA maturation RNase YbeY [Candidatus Moranbacteria bacterium RIFCSPHIGHO2_01_FULL_55_24]
MQVIVEHIEETATPFSAAFLQDVAERTLSRVQGLFPEEARTCELSAIAVSEEKIRELNGEYRGKDAVTDILSFAEYADAEALKESAESQIVLGELFYCPSFILMAAQEDGISQEHEMAYIFSHGILHLLGYDHTDEMFALQDSVTEEVVRDSLEKKKTV